VPLPVLDIEPADAPPVAHWQVDVDGRMVRAAATADGFAVWSSTGKRFHVWTAARRLLRDLWLVRRRGRSPLAFVHASSVDDGRNLLVFVGDKRAGKTSLMLDATLHHGWRIVSNDCLVVYRGPNGYAVSGLPTYVAIRREVVDRFGATLRARIVGDAANLSSWAHWERTPPAPGREHKLYLSHGAISRPVFPTIPLSQRSVTVVAVGFGGSAARVEVRPASGDPLAFLLANRKPVGFMVDAMRRRYGPVDTDPSSLGELASVARFVEYRHAGHCAGVLEMLASAAGGAPPAPAVSRLR
jgi:hypothetical protein